MGPVQNVLSTGSSVYVTHPLQQRHHLGSMRKCKRRGFCYYLLSPACWACLMELEKQTDCGDLEDFLNAFMDCEVFG
jgi:hypothetical protein